MLSRPARKSASSKKSPLKSSAYGITGRPAGPTCADRQQRGAGLGRRRAAVAGSAPASAFVDRLLGCLGRVRRRLGLGCGRGRRRRASPSSVCRATKSTPGRPRSGRAATSRLEVSSSSAPPCRGRRGGGSSAGSRSRARLGGGGELLLLAHRRCRRDRRPSRAPTPPRASARARAARSRPPAATSGRTNRNDAAR